MLGSSGLQIFPRRHHTTSYHPHHSDSIICHSPCCPCFWISPASVWTTTSASVWPLHYSSCCAIPLSIIGLPEYTIAAVGKRCQYYFIWGISEAGLNASGLGFNGFSDTGNQPRFDRYKNADPFQVRCHCYVPVRSPAQLHVPM